MVAMTSCAYCLYLTSVENMEFFLSIFVHETNENFLSYKKAGERRIEGGVLTAFSSF